MKLPAFKRPSVQKRPTTARRHIEWTMRGRGIRFVGVSSHFACEMEAQHHTAMNPLRLAFAIARASHAFPIRRLHCPRWKSTVPTPIESVCAMSRLHFPSAAHGRQSFSRGESVTVQASCPGKCMDRRKNVANWRNRKSSTCAESSTASA